ncbi:hypothetical protein [Nonomuraea sp. NPDC002799]
MSQPLTDQRPRAQLIAELYDRHAAGLFAYCADQLGDLGSASDVLASVLSGVPVAEPPRAALYAFARREIHRRDIVYSPPAVDPLIDPASALVERTLRELRPHQREVLVLCAVCGLSKAELAWVLDVAPDTAEELAVGAGHRFRQVLRTALATTRVRVPKPVADIYGALGISPLRDVLGRLPWPQPPGALRIHFAGSRPARPGPLFTKPRWPAPPMWPQPLADGDPATSTVIFPAELLTPPAPARVSPLEATTAPMPKLRDSLAAPGRSLTNPLAALAQGFWSARVSAQPPRDPRPSQYPHPSGQPLRNSQPAGRPSPYPPPSGPPSRNPQSAEQPFFLSAPVPADGPEPFATGDVLLPNDSPEPFATGDVLLPRTSGRSAPQPFTVPPRRQPWPVTAPLPEGPRPADDVLVHKGPARPLQPSSRADEPVRDAAPLFQPRAKPAEPVYRMPEPVEEQEAATDELPVVSVRPAEVSSFLAPRPVRTRPPTKRRPEVTRRPEKARRRRNRHYDWAWEVVGFLICVAIAMIVFFSVPSFMNP